VDRIDPEHVDERREGPRLIALVVEEHAAPHRRGLSARPLEEARDEPRLADPGLAGDEDDARLAAERCVPRVVERALFVLASDERVLGDTQLVARDRLARR